MTYSESLARNRLDAPIEWYVSDRLIPYEAAVTAMERRVAGIIEGRDGEAVWFLEHPPLYTGGTTAKPTDLRDPDRFPVYPTARGGQYTYHGPGQRVAYVMLDLRTRLQDVRAYVGDLEGWIIDALGQFNVDGLIRPDRVGVWVDRSLPAYEREDKIAAIGVRLRKWVTFHGIALNVEPDLAHFEGITPCGIADPRFGVTSLVDLGLPVTMDEVDDALGRAFATRFGPLHKTDTDFIDA